MEIPLFLAMTAGEMLCAEELPPHPAWMACHFSPYGTGLSNLPQALPEGAMLILNDRFPPDWHDPEQSAQMLVQAAQELKCSCILLDFQRQGHDKTASVVEAVLKKADCPVGVSSCYGDDRSCPVLLPPVPPHLALEEVVSTWKNRELWLEVSPEGTQITVTPQGSRYTALAHYRPGENAHPEERLCCHYEIQVSDEQIDFFLGRTPEDQAALLAQAKELGVRKAVGLWQEREAMFGVECPSG